MDVTFHDAREFEKWLRAIDSVNADRIVGKLRFAAMLGGSELGLPLVRALGGQLHELRVGKHRVYFTSRVGAMHVLTTGDKDTQRRDIARARRRIT